MSMTETLKLDRRVPIAVVLTLVAQTGAGLMWVGAADERLSQVEQAGSPERLARLEEQVIAMRVTVERVERKLDALSAGGR
jgi:hypothetical protein